MRYGILLLIAFFCCAGGESQEKPLKLNPHNGSTSVLIFGAKPAPQMIVICKTAGSDPEDVYDCEIQPGHTLTEVMRIVGRQLQDQRHGCDLLTRDLLGELLKAHPKPIEQHNKSKS